VTDAYFLYMIEFTSGMNPPGRCDIVREGLRSWIVAQGLSYGMGALGGSYRLYGYVGPGQFETPEVRDTLGQWIRNQRLCGTVRLGAIVGPDPPSLLDPITECVFEIDTLTESDRAEAAAYHDEVRRKIAAWNARPRGPTFEIDLVLDPEQRSHSHFGYFSLVILSAG